MAVNASIFYIFVGFVVVWLILVGILLIPTDTTSEPTLNPVRDGRIVEPEKVSLKTLIKKTTTYKTEVRSLKRSNSAQPNPPLPANADPIQVHIPLFSEWMAIRSEGGGPSAPQPQALVAAPVPVVEKPKVAVPVVLKTATKLKVVRKEPTGPVKAPHELEWPPVLSNGKIADSDGSDIMPLIDIEVPRFWFPAEGVDYNKAGSKVHGEETIFLMIASYRDFQCRETITSAYMRSDHPERLFVGAVDQTVPGDIGCLDLEVPCEKDPSQMICKYRDQISIYHMDAKLAAGPVTARHVGDRMYRGEYFVMQMDAHCQFVRHWDKLIIDQWRSTQNEMAVLSSYLTDVQGSFTPEGDSSRNTRPIMCNSDYEGNMPARYLRHGSQPENVPVIRDMPQLEPFWAAGFSFSRGHFKLRVPYDAYQPMVFQGEEIAIGIRGFTHGYDFYAPRDSVVFHEYASMSNRRKEVPFFTEHPHPGMGQKSLKRATAVIGMAPDMDESVWDHSELERYGLGKARSKELFYKLFLINTRARKATPLCPFVSSGVMHRDFQPYVRADRNGIDYSFLENYDTQDALQTRPRKDQPYWARQIEKGLNSKNPRTLSQAVSAAKQIGLYTSKPDLMNRAEKMLHLY